MVGDEPQAVCFPKVVAYTFPCLHFLLSLSLSATSFNLVQAHTALLKLLSKTTRNSSNRSVSTHILLYVFVGFDAIGWSFSAPLSCDAAFFVFSSAPLPVLLCSLSVCFFEGLLGFCTWPCLSSSAVLFTFLFRVLWFPGLQLWFASHVPDYFRSPLVYWASQSEWSFRASTQHVQDLHCSLPHQCLFPFVCFFFPPFIFLISVIIL